MATGPVTCVNKEELLMLQPPTNGDHQQCTVVIDGKYEEDWVFFWKGETIGGIIRAGSMYERQEPASRLLFHKHLGVGKKERIELISNTAGDIRRNVMPWYW